MAREATLAGDMLLGIDLGAGSLKATLVTVGGRTVASASASVTTSSPHPGWSEQDPADWWTALCIAVRQTLDVAGGAGKRVSAVSLSAGAHTQVLEDADGAVIRPAIMWNDQRAQAETRELQDDADERILKLAATAPTRHGPCLRCCGFAATSRRRSRGPSALPRQGLATLAPDRHLGD